MHYKAFLCTRFCRNGAGGRKKNDIAGATVLKESLAIHRFSGKAFHAGIEKHLTDGVEIKVYSPEKTLADCFKFRNKIGMDVVLEALKLYRSRKKLNMKDISYYARPILKHWYE